MTSFRKCVFRHRNAFLPLLITMAMVAMEVDGPPPPPSEECPSALLIRIPLSAFEGQQQRPLYLILVRCVNLRSFRTECLTGVFAAARSARIALHAAGAARGRQ